MFVMIRGWIYPGYSNPLILSTIHTKPGCWSNQVKNVVVCEWNWGHLRDFTLQTKGCVLGLFYGNADTFFFPLQLLIIGAAPAFQFHYHRSWLEAKNNKLKVIHQKCPTFLHIVSSSYFLITTQDIVLDFRYTLKTHTGLTSQSLSCYHKSGGSPGNISPV